MQREGESDGATRAGEVSTWEEERVQEVGERLCG